MTDDLVIRCESNRALATARRGWRGRFVCPWYRSPQCARAPMLSPGAPSRTQQSASATPGRTGTAAGDWPTQQRRGKFETKERAQGQWLGTIAQRQEAAEARSVGELR